MTTGTQHLAIAFECTIGLYSIAQQDNSPEISLQWHHEMNSDMVPETGILDMQWNHNNMVIVSSWLHGAVSLKPVKEAHSRMPDINPNTNIPITSLCMSKGSRYLSTASSNLLHIYDLKTKKVIKTFRGHDSHVTRVIFDHSDRHILSGATDGQILLHDANSSLITQSYKMPNSVTDLKCSPLMNHIFAASDASGGVRLWDIDVQREIYHGGFIHEAHRGGACTGVAFCSRNDQLLISTGHDEIINMWDIGAKRRAHSVHIERIRREAHDDAIRSIGGGITTMSFSGDGKNLATGMGSGHVLLFDVRYPDVPYHIIHASNSAIQCVRFQNTVRKRVVEGVERGDVGKRLDVESVKSVASVAEASVRGLVERGLVHGRSAHEVRNRIHMENSAPHEVQQIAQQEKSTPHEVDRNVGVLPASTTPALLSKDTPRFANPPNTLQTATPPPPKRTLPSPSFSIADRPKSSVLDSVDSILKRTEPQSQTLDHSPLHVKSPQREFAAPRRLDPNPNPNPNPKHIDTTQSPPKIIPPNGDDTISSIQNISQNPRQSFSTYSLPTETHTHPAQTTPPKSHRPASPSPQHTRTPNQPLSPLPRAHHQSSIPPYTIPPLNDSPQWNALQTYIDSKIQDVKLTLHKEMLSYHTELVKQFHQQQLDLEEKLEQFMERLSSITQENRQLRDENERLRREMQY